MNESISIYDLPAGMSEKIVLAGDGCWVWTGLLNSRGGPRFRAPEMDVTVRGFIAALVGESDGPTSVSCGSSLCVSPAHIIKASSRPLTTNPEHDQVRSLSLPEAERITEAQAALTRSVDLALFGGGTDASPEMRRVWVEFVASCAPGLDYRSLPGWVTERVLSGEATSLGDLVRGATLCPAP